MFCFFCTFGCVEFSFRFYRFQTRQFWRAWACDSSSVSEKCSCRLGCVFGLVHAVAAFDAAVESNGEQCAIPLIFPFPLIAQLYPLRLVILSILNLPLSAHSGNVSNLAEFNYSLLRSLFARTHGTIERCTWWDLKNSFCFAVGVRCSSSLSMSLA